MCVVLIIPKDVRPSLETLRLCERANPHGGGIAWRSAGSVEWLKTNDVAEIDKLARTMKGELIIHFRIASVGGVCDELRHPFPCTKKAKLDARGRTGAVLFQNGTWSGFEEALQFAEKEGHRRPEGAMSDSRAAAFLVSIYGHKFLKKCGHSRWAYFSGSETVRVGDWYKRDGIYFSNLYWLPPAPPKRPTLATGRRYEAEQFELPATGESREAKELKDLWDTGNVPDYWTHLRANSARVIAKRDAAKAAGGKPCNLCNGKGTRYFGAGYKGECEVCGGTGIQPKDEPLLNPVIPDHAYNK